ncbi:MAG: methylmalonyl Co-A mutase-associated GTPase MeaB [Asgard group archaeon]|nr:methylmalonyl Co-A mutase-associated GTPase MeaB [Asgard group archaeon]
MKLNSDFLNDIDNTNFNKIARVITHIENETEQGIEIIQALPYNLEKKQVIGITGSPGSGKSTLINQLIKKYISIGSKIAILAIDPSSPYSGGSLLGDRIRMISDISHPNLYIRSLSSRGQLGGLSTFTYDILRLLQFLKFDKIIIETVGSGQSEIDVSKLSDTTIVTLTPNMGDEIQMIKSGIMEIANIFVINKLDILDVKRLKSKLKNSITLNSETNNTPNIIEISALKDIGIDKLCVAIDEHFNSIKQTDILNIKRTNQLKFDLKNKLMKQYREKLSLAEDQIDSVIKELQENKISLKNALKKLE